MAYSGHGLSGKEMVILNSIFVAYFSLIYMYYLYCIIKFKRVEGEHVQLDIRKNKIIKKGSCERVSVDCYDFVYGGLLSLNRDKARRKSLELKAKRNKIVFAKKIGRGYVCNYYGVSLYPLSPALFFIVVVCFFYRFL